MCPLAFVPSPDGWDENQNWNELYYMLSGSGHTRISLDTGYDSPDKISRLIEFTVQLSLWDGTVIEVDPIWDERHG